MAPTNEGSDDTSQSAEALVSRRLRDLRVRQGFSLRALAERSGLNVNTLSLVENGKSSPSVSTLQQLALALGVPISSFFETEPAEKRVVFTPAGEPPQITIGSTRMKNLGKEYTGNAVQPFAVSLGPGMGSGDRAVVHTGHEFIYCLNGGIHFEVEEEEYTLRPGDCLLFEAHLPHRWENRGVSDAKFLLVLFPTDERDEPVIRHFSPATLKKELNMKVAVITDDGETISQHFGRAPYYLVLMIEQGEVVNRELRNKVGHGQFGEHHLNGEHHGAGHGSDSASHNRHVSMAEAIQDCEAVICGGMGMGAYESMRSLNITPVVTDLRDIDAAVKAYIDGKLVDHTEKLH